MASAPFSQSVPSSWFVAAWLPPGGHGNGLFATNWAPIADVDAKVVDALLDLLAEAGVPAHAAVAPRPVRPLLPQTGGAPEIWRLWVGSTSYRKGEHVLMTRLPALLREVEKPARPVPHRQSRPHRPVRKWRTRPDK